ncbi:uncharacterized protein LOC118463802 [Anopheles albimanus]|uniref:uncharacterized protein LOC118463802 n=1 Tax=Anopheles albimanus TaxID=7167 RepID=UPI00163EBA4B|nr:uncharacterized protein LOC118463802 [Anopheles albimanus]
MKCLGVLVALCAFVAVQGFAQNLPIVKPSKRTAVAPPVVDTVNFDPSYSCDPQNRITCGSCSSVMICNFNGNRVGGYECSSIDPSRPYCTGNGICSSEPADGCNVQSDLCPTADKFYPVPSNCSELVYCDSKQVAVTIPSPASTAIFNYASQSWTLRVAPTDCFQINCDAAGQLDKWYAYKPSPQLSIYCSSQGPMTFVCPNEKDVFNESKKSCEFACFKEGNFPFPGDSTKYYFCLSDQKGGFQKFENSCLPGFIFNDTKCVRDTSTST